MIRRPPKSTPFPYPTLFRSQRIEQGREFARRSGTEREQPRAAQPPHHVQIEHRVQRVNWLRDSMLHEEDRKSTRLNSSHSQISYAVFCLKKKKNSNTTRSLF